MIVPAMSSTSVARMETGFKKDKTQSNITLPLNKLLLLLEKQTMLSCRVEEASQNMDTLMKIAMEVLFYTFYAFNSEQGKFYQFTYPLRAQQRSKCMFC